MAMRRAAFDPGTVKGSAKLRRLTEIAGEAADDGHKVVVFSYFRDVLTTVTRVLGSGADSVDQRILELLHGKRAAFDKYARRSDVAESAPEALDVSDPAAETELQRRIVESERRRLDVALRESNS